ncbi:esterase [Longispora fulva]|uniref:S-formylglutathione hydrolase FrmB n=1 Tax=Longispora fulva TaxID=619741 RepID=A0A8J7GKA0_9ACTN|nr:alpha/beta hydrolase-fold protein [Longispora fulva]MBG6138203.1 S-formylglutathione hydrolase FrmB [Longispora fulva]GIG60456.1 esterase [Longispora fulva]
MTPTSLDLQFLTIGVAVATTVFVAWAWPRVRWGRWLIRPVLLTLCALTAFSVVGVAVNRIMFLAPTWGHVFGDRNAAAVPIGDDDGGTVPTAAPGQSRMEQFTPALGKSGIALPVIAYLPPGYDQSDTVRYPVITAYAGFPGTPNTWVSGTGAQRMLDAEIAAHRMAPTIVIYPTIHPDPKWDSECVNAEGGPQFETYLTEDVPQAVKSRFRVRGDRAAWGVIGFSTGGYCAVNHVLRHPGTYAAAASLSGYFKPLPGGEGGTQDLFKGNEKARQENAPLWRVQNLPVPDVDIWYGAANDDKVAMAGIKEFAPQVRAPIRFTTAFIPTGGHTLAAWMVLIPSALDWLSARLAAPQSLS